MSPLAVFFGIFLGLILALIVQSIQIRVVRRRFIRYFGRNATQSEVDGKLVAMAGAIAYSRRQQLGYVKSFLFGMSESIDLDEKSPERKKAESIAKALLKTSLSWKRAFRRGRRGFRRAQRLAKHHGFPVRKDYTDYLR